MKTTVINLLAGPGVGKSTLSCGLFHAMKLHGLNVELVREYAKNWAWDNRKPNKYDQIYFFGKQVRAESLLYGKVDYIITDSPVLLSAYYEDKYCKTKITLPSVLEFWKHSEKNDIDRFNFFLARNKTYVPKGRFETEDEARQIDKELRSWLKRNHISFEELTVADEERVRFIFNRLGLKYREELK